MAPKGKKIILAAPEEVQQIVEKALRCLLQARPYMHERKETWSEATPEGRWRCYDYDDLLKRDKLNLDLFWIKDKSLTDTDALPAPDILAAEIADDLETALEQFTKIAARLGRQVGRTAA